MEQNSGAVLRLPDAGSDENYLAIHIALSFALQKYLAKVNAPVPGFLAFDQISRPYYPQRGDDESDIGENEEVSAMRKHLDFLFNTTDAQEGLQVLLIEHAYFGDDQGMWQPLVSAGTRFRAMLLSHWTGREDRTQ
ncbi:DUF3732 domain-containing protein [Pseudomonas qingdaonensis]|nr:DUF3732 domain-containing protein [Pseudomonas qingdaonensis]